MKKLYLAIALGCATGTLWADEPQTNESLLNLRVEARLDWQGDWLDGKTIDDNTGFEGKYLNLRLDGNITDNLSYSWRQRLNKAHKDVTYFDATDWVYLQYNLDKWIFAGGKQVVAIGGYEYDRAPIDLFGCSVFWNNIPCYQLGGSVGYKLTPNDKLTAQFIQSPFHTSDNRNMYGYSVMWNGNHGIFNSIYSANLFEYLPGKYISYIALGNRFDFGKVALELDLMNRASSHQTFLFKDASVMAELQYKPAPKWNIFGKFTYDVNNSGTGADFTVTDGTELKMAGGGVEFMPFVNNRHVLRFHASGFYSWGKNANVADVMQRKTLACNIGVTWYMDLLSFKRK